MSLVKKFAKSFSYAFAAQILSLLVSILFSIGFARLLPVQEFGLWQLFILYSSYIGFFHFGICDGIYLKLGGRNYKTLHAANTSQQFGFYAAIQLVVSLLILGAAFFIQSPDKSSIIRLAALFLLVGNLQIFLSFVLIATNRIKPYSISVMLEKVLIVLLFGVLYSQNAITYSSLIWTYIACKALSLLFLLGLMRDKLFTFSAFHIRNISIFKTYTISGIILMFSNIFSTLIIGNARFMIEHRFGLEAFSKVSFSISLVYIVVVLISQTSVVLFPMLRNMNAQKQAALFKKFNVGLSLILLVSFVIYYPLTYLIETYLHKYADGIFYLGILLPICIYDGKMQILFNTYFKTLKAQNRLLRINLISLVLSLLLCFMAAYFFNSIFYVLIALLIAVAFRSIYAEYLISRYLKVRLQPLHILALLGVSVIFIVFNYFRFGGGVV